ncbi:MAG: zinc metalloprotease [Actinomycetota bacterium]|nr:zinc metalloprotease [Actinomycetota bacterium]
MTPEGRPSHPICGAMWMHERLRELDPGLRTRRAELKERVRESITSGEASAVTRKLVTLTTVVHVVHRTDEENISDEQVASQIEALNRDFRAQNDDRSRVPEVWRGLVADANIAFVLAGEDPQGNPTNGITRTETQRESFPTENDPVKRPERGGIAPWPTDRYLNLWVCNLEHGLLGYAQFPGGPPETDGVVIRYTAFGMTGTAQKPYDLGRTATHEVGHFLNLFHIWGDSDDCSGSDEVSDTPGAQQPHYGKPTFPTMSCTNAPNGDMFVNYMDYSDDDCMFMFTPGQVLRMNAALATERAPLAGLA